MEIGAADRSKQHPGSKDPMRIPCTVSIHREFELDFPFNQAGFHRKQMLKSEAGSKTTALRESLPQPASEG